MVSRPNYLRGEEPPQRQEEGEEIREKGSYSVTVDADNVFSVGRLILLRSAGLVPKAKKRSTNRAHDCPSNVQRDNCQFIPEHRTHCRAYDAANKNVDPASNGRD
jgi:hypothetical protein